MRVIFGKTAHRDEHSFERVCQKILWQPMRGNSLVRLTKKIKHSYAQLWQHIASQSLRYALKQDAPSMVPLQSVLLQEMLRRGFSRSASLVRS